MQALCKFCWDTAGVVEFTWLKNRRKSKIPAKLVQPRHIALMRCEGRLLHEKMYVRGFI